MIELKEFTRITKNEIDLYKPLLTDNSLYIYEKDDEYIIFEVMDKNNNPYEHMKAIYKFLDKSKDPTIIKALVNSKFYLNMEDNFNIEEIYPYTLYELIVSTIIFMTYPNLDKDNRSIRLYIIDIIRQLKRRKL